MDGITYIFRFYNTVTYSCIFKHWWYCGKYSIKLMGIPLELLDDFVTQTNYYFKQLVYYSVYICHDDSKDWGDATLKILRI